MNRLTRAEVKEKYSSELWDEKILEQIQEIMYNATDAQTGEMLTMDEKLLVTVTGGYTMIDYANFLEAHYREGEIDER